MHEPGGHGRGGGVAAALWGGAAVLALLVAALGMRLVGEARAETVSRAGEFTLLTAEAGSEDVLVALDNRREQLLIYKVVNQSSLELFGRHDVARIFADARARAQGRK